jgi:hypothetical protein
MEPDPILKKKKMIIQSNFLAIEKQMIIVEYNFYSIDRMIVKFPLSLYIEVFPDYLIYLYDKHSKIVQERDPKNNNKKVYSILPNGIMHGSYKVYNFYGKSIEYKRYMNGVEIKPPPKVYMRKGMQYAIQQF